MAALQRGGWLALFRTLAPPTPDSDADLLARFVSNRDEAALDAVVRRYAEMVMGVCRRRLGDTPDADDAFQATFLVLAKSAGSVSRGASLPAWLHRVAYLTSLKLAGRLHRRGTTPMDAEPADPRSVMPDSACERGELKAVLDEELAALPEKFRGPVVLCCLEGHTNAEAAAALGVPVGTVDSRLHAAKAKLRGRLTKRGLAGAVMSFTVPAGVGASDELIRTTVRAAFAYSAGSHAAGPVITALAREVSSTMTTFPIKLLAATAMIATLAGGLGTGVYFANAGDDPTKPAAKAKPDAKKAEEKPKVEAIAGTRATYPNGSVSGVFVVVKAGTTAETTQLLSQRVPKELVKDNSYQLGQVFEILSQKFSVTIRAEENFLKSLGIDNPYEKTVIFRFDPSRLTLEDLLTEITSQICAGQSHVGFRVKANQFIFGEVFRPTSIPSAFAGGANGLNEVDRLTVFKMLYGPTVSITVKEKSLTEIVDMLREQTGANIVVDLPGEFEGSKKVSLTLNDTKLFTVLKVVSDMFGLAPASVDNVYCITTGDKAGNLNREMAIAMFGEEKPSIVYVPVNLEGKFMPPGPEGFRSQKFQFVPVRVDEIEKEKEKATPKPEAKKP